MGFFDNILTKVGAVIATKYGTVMSGRHEGCAVALGNPPNEKVSVANKMTQIVFVSGTEEKGRYFIEGEIKSLEKLHYDKEGNKYRLTFVTGETCDMEMYSDKLASICRSMSGCLK